jgi:hypothetical protein
MFRFLRAIDLHPIEWEEAAAAVGKPDPFIDEILDKGFSLAQAVVVLLTPDDEGRQRAVPKEGTGHIDEAELTPQARLNVIYEGGIARASHSDRTIWVELGKVREFSDRSGRHVVRLNNSTSKRQELARRLRDAKCDVNTLGVDWHEEGDFEEAVREPYRAFAPEDENHVEKLEASVERMLSLIERGNIVQRWGAIEAEREKIEQLGKTLSKYPNLHDDIEDFLLKTTKPDTNRASRDPMLLAADQQILRFECVLLQKYIYDIRDGSRPA